jgi:hypothetical protein
MPAFSSTMSIRFIRDTTNSSTDDVMSIRKNFQEGEFVVTYTDENQGSPVFHTISFGCRMDLVNHLYLTLKNQAIDDDGFKSVQFSLPAMPRILVDAWKFKEVYYREHFLDLLENGLDTLDRVETTSAAQKAREKAKAKAEAQKAKLEAEKAKAEEEQARNPAYYYDFTYDDDIYPEEKVVTPVKTRRRSSRLSSGWYESSYPEKCEA